MDDLDGGVAGRCSAPASNTLALPDSPNILSGLTVCIACEKALAVASLINS